MYFALNQNRSLKPRIALRWGLNAISAVSLGYELHSQVVSLPLVLGRVRLPDNTYIQPNANLGFIRSHHFVVSYVWLLTANTRLKAEAYYQRIFDAAVDASANNSYSILNQGASFYNEIPNYIKSAGTDNNWGVELTMERFLTKGLYFLITMSIFESQYRGSDGILHNTAFNQQHITNVLISKEFNLSNNEKSQKFLAIDAKVVYSGGKRATPWHAWYNPVTQKYARIYDDSQAYSLQLKDFFKTDLSIRYKLNKMGYTQEWAIEITNMFNNKNIFSEKFNTSTGEGKYTYQLEIMVIPQYRIIF